MTKKSNLKVALPEKWTCLISPAFHFSRFSLIFLRSPLFVTDLLLPDVLPTGPSMDQSEPVFLEVPAAAYVRRSKPATLTCRAAHALHLYFLCNDQLMAAGEHSRADYVDPETAIRQLELRLDVSRREVERYFDDFTCACVALSSRSRKTSPPVKVTVACKYTL